MERNMKCPTWEMCLILWTAEQLINVLCTFRHLQKAKLKHASAVVIRDSLRNEVSKQQMNAEELKEKREQQVKVCF